MQGHTITSDSPLGGMEGKNTDEEYKACLSFSNQFFWPLNLRHIKLGQTAEGTKILGLKKVAIPLMGNRR